MKKKSAGGKREFWVGFDLGATKMMAVVYDAKFRPLARRRRKTKGHTGTNQGLARLAETITDCCAEAGVKPERLAGIGVGAPGPLDMVKGVIPVTPNLAWRDARVKDYLQRKFKCPVVLVNDVDAGVYGEYRFGAGRKAHSVLGVFPGTGIGGGCVIDGRIVAGRRLSCMEIGHICVQPGGPLCGCGQRGCLEAVASRLAIASAVVSAAYRGEAPHVLRTAGTDLTNIRSAVLSEAIKAGDKAVERIVRNAARWLGTGVAAVVNLLLPDVVVLGGGLVEEMPSLYLKEVAEATERAVMPPFRGVYKIRVAELGDDAAAQGAAAWARSELEGGHKE